MKVLFICAENTCRSQIAEGLAKAADIDCESAGLKAGSGVNPKAIAVMEELGIDISDQYSKSIDELENPEGFNLVVSLCHADAKSVCPHVNIERKENWKIDDPKGSNLDVYRRARDLIAMKLKKLKVVLEQ